MPIQYSEFNSAKRLKLFFYIFVRLDDPGSLRWCCDRLWATPDLIPGTEMGELGEDEQTWKDKRCYELVGASYPTNDEPNCRGIIILLNPNRNLTLKYRT